MNSRTTAAVAALNDDRIRRAVASADPERPGVASLEEAFDREGVQDGPEAQAVLRLWEGRRRAVRGWTPGA